MSIEVLVAAIVCAVVFLTFVTWVMISEAKSEKIHNMLLVETFRLITEGRGRNRREVEEGSDE